MATAQALYEHFSNPVDMVEHIATVHDWTFERSAPDELTLSVAGAWCDYHISLTWRDDLEALHLACAFECKIGQGRLAEIYRLMALINEQLWLGHFDLWKEDGMLLYRHGLLLAGAHTHAGQCEALLRG
ncbi:MAG: YbjN domain-containing protein, partial [Methyloceanibacter sp.]